ncbi:hypothetical protein N0M98_32480 [Paenibacillus doosanensis]|uniref:Uncharacterized protein n=1 Tax=Paenibacillus konkukensis TaxID=2020716 RepID=A0ABY4RLH3_9BACL|nr:MULTISPECIES: hypothetical protein [Paenibacillus]MCS7464801.1 hypothetical protein [Paenibacillus doosanensis]UQZ83356.1 hypothetical protein SK3146_02543 [Paenibacillus konkukensis]
MVYKEKLLHLLDGLNELDQKAAYEYIQSLARRSSNKAESKEVVHLYGKDYFIVPD